MKENNHPIAVMLRMLFLAYHKNMSQDFEMFNVYFEQLKHCRPELFAKACHHIIDTKKFFPKVAEIREKLSELDQDKKLLAGETKIQRIKLTCCGSIYERVYVRAQSFKAGKPIMIWVWEENSRKEYEDHAAFCLKNRHDRYFGSLKTGS